MTPADDALVRAHREEWARAVASLARRFADLDLAEDCVGEAFVIAVEHWRAHGTPTNPGAWLTVTATRKAIDRVRRESQRQARHEAAHMIVDRSPAQPTGPITDDRLRLVFTCCHPALAPEARIALTLRLVCGLTVPEIAAAFLVPETTVAQRITRAKAKIRDAHIPYRVPGPEDIAARLDSVLTVIFLVFNEGYLPTGDTAARPDLTAEAVHLARMLHALLPDEGEVAGLLALLLLSEARRETRFASSGRLVTLPEQDRTRWASTLIAEGHALVRARIAAVAAGAPRPGRYQVLAAINAVHTAAPTAEETDWRQIVALYDQLVRLDASPIVRLNRAVALAELDGPRVALAELQELSDPLAAYHAFHVTRAELLRRSGDMNAARAAYDRALQIVTNPAERAHLEERRASL